MTKLSLLNNSIKKYYLFLLGPIVFFYIGFHLINGNNGLLAHVYLNEDIKSLESSIYNISKDNKIIQLKILELQSDKNSDIRDEMVREILNFSQDDEYTIIFD